MYRRIGLCLFLGILALAARQSTAGTVITVGPGRQFGDLPQAVAVAQSGDLILVDPQTSPNPTPYSPIVIHGRGISILSSVPGQRYLIAATSLQPGIDVSSIIRGESVTIYEADIQYPDSAAPAIRVQTSAGGVRFQNVKVLTQSNLTSGPSAMIEVDHSESVWLSQVEARANGWGVDPSGNGVHGLLLRNSGALVQSSVITAFNSSTGRGGNGIHLDQSQLWTTAISFGSTFITGGNGSIGGNGIFLTDVNTSHVLGCSKDSSTQVVVRGGSGLSVAQRGQDYFATGGSGSNGGVQWSAAMPICAGDAGIVYSTIPDRVRIGTMPTFTLEAVGISTSSVGLHGLALGTPFIYWQPISPNGFLAWDLNTVHGQAGGGTGLSAVGVWPAYPKSIPGNPGLIGYQLSVQGWLTVPAALSLGEPQMLVVVP